MYECNIVDIYIYIISVDVSFSLVLLTGRVVAPVLQSLQTFDKDLKDLAPSPWHMVVEIGKDSWKEREKRNETSLVLILKQQVHT